MVALLAPEGIGVRWVVGDIQGCARELDELLETIRFDPARDELWSLGDLVNRGPDSLAVMRTWRSVGGLGLLGNHDVGALLTFSGARPRKMPLLAKLFEAPDADDLLASLRALPVLVPLESRGAGPDVWIVHAGLRPDWTDLAAVAERINRPPHDDHWLRDGEVAFATNVRCCTADGWCPKHTGFPEDCPAPSLPWDAFYRGGTLVVHGHWAMRGYYRGARTMGLDSGCVYGGGLTAWCQDEDRIVRIPSRAPAGP
jgi:bis(5'-nucleosyl)-tetraphosphatase (symmetrical)